VVLKLWGATPKGVRGDLKWGAAYFPTDKNYKCPKSIKKITKNINTCRETFDEYTL
jgi:hypothetical protein